MTRDELKVARKVFTARLHSLKVDVEKCLSRKTPGFAFFPAVLYSFATLDYFSSFWAGWNEGGRGRNQTDRMVGFSERFLSYPRKEAQIAINIWRHKLIHTGEPRVLASATTPERYLWSTGRGQKNHMILVPTANPNEYRFHFAPIVFAKQLRKGVFGLSGYFHDLSLSADLQAKWKRCKNEFTTYKIRLRP